VAERFFGSLKREFTDHRLYATREEAREDVVDHIEMFYNSRRRHPYLGYSSPAKFEALARVAQPSVRFLLTTTCAAGLRIAYRVAHRPGPGVTG
jgi:hypothetical protein